MHTPEEAGTVAERDGRTRREALAKLAAVAGGAGAVALIAAPEAFAATTGDYVSVRDAAHGARGDGVTNDRAAIQSACNAAGAAGGGTVFFPAGTYAVDATTAISVGDNVVVAGVGRASKIRCSNERTTSLLYMLRCPDGANVRVRDLWLDGPDQLGTGGEVRLLHHDGEGGALLVTDCLLRKAATAIKVDPQAAALHVARCEFTGQSAFGILTSGAVAGDTRINVRDCFFHDLGTATTDHAIYVPNNHSLDVEGCRFTDLTGYGVHVYGQTSGSNHCRVRACSFDGAMRGAIVTNAYTPMTIAHCQFRVTTSNLQVKISGTVRIVDCDFEGKSNGIGDIYNTNDGIPPYDVTIERSRFFGSATGASCITIQFAGAQSWRITGCDFRGGRAVGVLTDPSMDSSSSVRIDGNSWDQATGVDYAIELHGPGTVVVDGNEFKELRSTSGYAIRCGSGAPTRLAVLGNDFSQDNADRSVSFAGTLPAFHAAGNHGPSGGLAWRDVASAATVTLPPLGRLFRITGTTAISSLTASWSGREISLRFASTPTIADGSNLRLAGGFSATADDVLTLVCDGTNWYETARAVN